MRTCITFCVCVILPLIYLFFIILNIPCILFKPDFFCFQRYCFGIGIAELENAIENKIYTPNIQKFIDNKISGVLQILVIKRVFSSSPNREKEKEGCGDKE